ncbi:ALDH-like protein [Plenodomus tracheiphilus IPT5]|uniref:ALDH-like protein n=1 Tax=Plenodomus tracheiphilus IPT5 TaxID=1408161 RepID=A0A6A7BMK3_9PLEO|nr:ALDH-like protein [Plenodomus tracheiphilus IPT5]
MSSLLTPEVAFANLQATALSARCHNSFFRQKQLKTLHDVLRNNSSALKDAVKQDTRVSDEEAATEVALSLSIVKEHYGAIDAKKELEQEYRITNGKDADDKREPWGVAYIEPQQNHTPFFAVIAPLGAALAAGNCVVLKLESNLRALPSLVPKLLSEALESDTFAIISTEPGHDVVSSHFQVLQETHRTKQQRMVVEHSKLVSPGSRTIAIVDRTADLALAAEQLVTARFAFGGSSPYAPDIILVNEYIKKEFVEHILKHSIRFLAGSNDLANGSTKPKKTSNIASSLKPLQESKSWRLNTITQGDTGAIIELTNLSTLPPKSAQPILALSSITSLEHAISLVDEDLDTQETLLAAYHFGTPSAGKYLSQFIAADVSFINHIPTRLLLGPAAPSHHPIDLNNRYTTLQFTRAAPAYITAPSSQSSLANLITGKESRKAAAELLAQATQEIKEKKRAEWIAIGYFEQGILIGLSLVGIPLLTGVGTALFFGVRAGLRRWGFSQ